MADAGSTAVSQVQPELRECEASERRVTDLDAQIKETRDYLYHFNKSILWSHIFKPMAAHGSHLIYAPDEVLHAMWKHRGRAAALCRSIDIQGALQAIREKASTNKLFVVFSVASMVVFKVYGKAMSLALQNFLLGWAEYNTSLHLPWLFASITLMMCVRMIVSNVLPFTSPVFAFLVAQSMPSGMDWAGTFFLLACSVPAGLMIPALDEILFLVYGRKHGHGKENNTGYQGPDGWVAYPEDYDHRFWGTWFLMHLTDWLPFSFWVRPYFMEPVYRATKDAGVGPEGAASAAVLAGHFMIWAGPATTMCQRKFAPDWTTCAIIQPLGLMEDVAVVLAAWAGKDAASAKQAEIGLYIFMATMNLVHLFSTNVVEPRNRRRSRRTSEDKMRRAETKRKATIHLIVLIITAIALAVCVATPAHIEDTSTTTAVPGAGAAPHENLSTMIQLTVKVSVIAVLARVAARTLSRLCSMEAPQEKNAMEPLLD